MIRILVYINSLISCLASPAFLEEVKMDRVWVLPPEKQLLDDAFKSITFPNNNIYNFWWKEGYYFRSYNEREYFGVYILFDFSKEKKKNPQNQKQYPRYKGIVTLAIMTCIQVFLHYWLFSSSFFYKKPVYTLLAY